MTGLVDAIHNGEGNCWTMKVRGFEFLSNSEILKSINCLEYFMYILLYVRYEEELIEAIEMATGEKKYCPCFIEVIVHKDDTSKELLEWGVRGLFC